MYSVSDLIAGVCAGLRSHSRCVCSVSDVIAVVYSVSDLIAGVCASV